MLFLLVCSCDRVVVLCVDLFDLFFLGLFVAFWLFGVLVHLPVCFSFCVWGWGKQRNCRERQPETIYSASALTLALSWAATLAPR